jgi:dienelactone hydrolase
VLAVDTTRESKRPGVLVIPEYWGMNDYVTSRATMLADMGYVAFVADMYGEGRITKDSAQAGKWAGEVKGDRLLMRQRANAALEQLKAQPNVEPNQIAAIGYCFGGTTVLEMARSNADVLGVVSFHGGLEKGDAESSPTIQPKVLVLHGAADTHVSDASLAELREDLHKANADWYMVVYGHSAHAFTNPAAGNNPSKGVAYNEKADRRSWDEMQDFFRELFPGFNPPAQKFLLIKSPSE